MRLLSVPMTLREWMYMERIGTSALARQLGVTPGTITHLKKRRRSPSAALVAKIDTITQGAVTVGDLLRNQDVSLAMPAVVSRPISKPARRRTS